MVGRRAQLILPVWLGLCCCLLKSPSGLSKGRTGNSSNLEGWILNSFKLA